MGDVVNLREPVTIEALRASKLDFVMHVGLGRGEHGYMYRCVEYPRLTLHKRSKAGRVVRRVYVVGDNETEVLGDVVHLLNGEEEVVALKEDMRAVAALMSQAAGKLNLMTESGKLNPDEMDAACAAAEQALALMPGLKEKVEAYRVEHKAKTGEPDGQGQQDRVDASHV